jgi:hypothetical protein
MNNVYWHQFNILIILTSNYLFWSYDIVIETNSRIRQDQYRHHRYSGIGSPLFSWKKISPFFSFFLVFLWLTCVIHNFMIMVCWVFLCTFLYICCFYNILCHFNNNMAYFNSHLVFSLYRKSNLVELLTVYFLNLSIYINNVVWPYFNCFLLY